jgi:hypothetical protein
MATRSIPRRKAKTSLSVPVKPVPEAAPTEEPINTIDNALGRARAAADLLINITTITNSGAIDELDESTLNWTVWDIRQRIDEALAAANELHHRYSALKQAAREVVS